MERRDYFPPLSVAVGLGQLDYVTYLIEKGADLDGLDSAGGTPLHYVLEGMKSKNDSNTNKVFLKIAQLLVNKGAKVDVMDNTRQSPLTLAVVNGEFKLLNILLSTPNPVNLNTILKNNITLLHLAVSYYVLSSTTAGPNSKELLKKQEKIIRLLITKGADVNKPYINGKTDLHNASEAGYYNLIKLLIECNVDINKRSKSGKVALHYAAHNGNIKLVRLLLESKAEVNIKDKVGSTPFDYGIMENEYLDYMTIQLLIDYGADIYNRAIVGMTRTYDILVAMMRCDVLKLFWSQGYPYDLTLFHSPDNLIETMCSFFDSVGLGNIVAQDFKRRFNTQAGKALTDLMGAQRDFLTGVERHNVKLVLSGMQRGAEVRGCSVGFLFPLHFVAKSGFIDVAQILLSNGVVTNALDDKGNSPLDYATKGGHFEMYLILLQYGACYQKKNDSASLEMKQENIHIQELYSSINQAFGYVKQDDHRILKKLKKLIKLQDWNNYQALVNCVDRKGRTLMGLAVEKGKSYIAEQLMLYRIKAYVVCNLLS